MRTTLELDDDLLAIARQLARQQGATVGQVISKAARQSLIAANSSRIRNGVPLFVPTAGVTRRPNLEVVNALRDGA